MIETMPPPYEGGGTGVVGMIRASNPLYDLPLHKGEKGR
jgi:hypothetical protein